MSTKFIRFVAALAVIISIAGNTGVASAERGAPPSLSSQKLDASTLPLVAAQRPPSAPESQPLNIPALTIPPASLLGVQFVHVATAANTINNLTVIDHPLTNGHPDAIILVTPNWNPGGIGGTPDDHPISVAYNAGQWGIFNQDGTNMPPNAAFNVIIPTAGANVFVHTATAVSGDHTFINNPLANGHPNAIILVTPNRDPGGICPCVPTNFPIGVSYSSTDSKWAIFNQDLAAMPLNASFNVFVLTAGAGVFVQTATMANIGGGATIIDNPLTNGHPNAIVFVTPNLTPGGVGGTADDHPIAAFYDGSQWAIINQGPTDVPLDASFNVLVLVPRSDIFVHTATTDNIHFNHTNIDNALTNGHPNAIVFTTPNWNPGGVGGTGNNHNIGVQTEGQWEIFNQDGWTILDGTAFNVLVPNPDTSVFVHKTTAANRDISWPYSTIIDYPLTNGNPDAIILVTPNLNPGWVGGVSDDNPIGVFYDNAISRWRIFNQGNTVPIPLDAAFNVFVPTAGVGVFVHKATLANIAAQRTTIDYSLTNGNPNAIILVTQNYNPGGAGGTQNDHPIGVFYNNITSKWEIFNQDNLAMPLGAAFNVYVFANYKIYLPLIRR